MTKVLNQVHNLMLNCNDTNELTDLVFDLSLGHIYNDHYDSIFDTIISNPVLAAECSVLPIYYLEKSSATSQKQDRFGKFYIVE